jgi:hypothetical protein
MSNTPANLIITAASKAYGPSLLALPGSLTQTPGQKSPSDAGERLRAFCRAYFHTRPALPPETASLVARLASALSRA